MKSFEYQVLRFLPDQVSGEFINVGIVIYSRSDKYLKAGFQKRISRISSFFPTLEVRHIMSSLKSLESTIYEFSLQLSTELAFDIPDSVVEITNSLGLQPDTSLLFSESKKGIDTSLEEAFQDLFSRLILRYEQPVSEAELQNDEDVWNKLFRKYFDQQQITHQLYSHTVKTPDEEYKFELSWKNEHLHCFEPVLFNLQKEESIQRKVERWLGRMVNLSKSEEPIEIFLLSKLPSKPKLKDYVIKKLQDFELGRASIKIIHEDFAHDFAQHVKEEIDAHSKEVNT